MNRLLVLLVVMALNDCVLGYSKTIKYKNNGWCKIRESRKTILRRLRLCKMNSRTDFGNWNWEEEYTEWTPVEIGKYKGLNIYTSNNKIVK